MTPDLPAARAAEVDTYVFRATYAGRRVRVIEALPAAQWLIWLDGVPVSVSSQSLSDFRSERDPEPAPDLGPLFDTRQILTTDDGRHWDTDGREHNLVDVDGEATYVPVTGQKTALGRMTRTQDVLSEVLDERLRQDAKWGEQNHPDGTGQWPESVYADTARMATEHAAEGGYLDWLHILREEVAEAFAEPRPDRLRAELVQVAAVAVAWVEAIDRRAVAVADQQAAAVTPQHRNAAGDWCRFSRCVTERPDRSCPACRPLPPEPSRAAAWAEQQPADDAP